MIIGSLDFDPDKRTYIMGILNTTPDSFSDGGRFNDPERAVEHALEMAEAGADIIDVGGESTRPGHAEVTVHEEISRIIPVIKKITDKISTPVSVDTSKAEVAYAAVKNGAALINDVWGFKKDPEIASVAAQEGVPCCLMHNRNNTEYKDLMSDIKRDLEKSIQIALDAGVARNKIILDPGIGFGKTLEQNIEVLGRLSELKELGFPLLLGTSRKSVIGLTLNLPVDERLEGTIATTVVGIAAGYSIIRVHDVEPNLRAARMADSILRRKNLVS